MKKLFSALSLVLVFVFVFSTVAFAVPSRLEDGFVLYETRSIGLVEEVREFDGSVFYFRMTDEYTYSSQLTPLGYYVFGFRFNNSSEVLTGTFSVIDSGVMQRSRISGSLEDNSFSMFSLVVNNLDIFVTETIDMTNYVYQYVLPLPDDNRIEHFDLTDIYADWQDLEGRMFTLSAFPAPPPSGRIFSNLNTLVASDFPGQYANRFLQQHTELRGGRIANARLYETYTAFARHRVSIGAIANFAITTIGALLGLDFSTIKAIITTTIGLGGVVVAGVDAFIHRAEVVQSFTRLVVVNGGPGTMIWSAHDTSWDVIEGNRGAQIDATRNPRINSFWDFTDIQHLLRTGINNWASINNIW